MFFVVIPHTENLILLPDREHWFEPKIKKIPNNDDDTIDLLEYSQSLSVKFLSVTVYRMTTERAHRAPNQSQWRMVK